MPYNKTTRHSACYIQNAVLQYLRRTCAGDHGHVILSGLRPRAGQPQKTMMRTENGSASYPVALRVAWAKLALELLW
ncbi:hypothetical protein N9L68_08790 [bacterium]|nr:hypothetical protein [bacterium]